MQEKRSARLGGLALVLAALAMGIAAMAWYEARRKAPADNASPAAQSEEAWLTGSYEQRFAEIERQFRGTDVAMAEVGYRFAELYHAGGDGNWPYARYQTEKIATAIERALVRRPKRAASARPFLAEELPAVLRAIEAENPAEFRAAMDRLRTSCMKCHTQEDVPWITVEFPAARPAAVRTAR
jgi:hypothetical protein